MEDSILAVLGEEVTGVVTPVSICMALTVFLVQMLNPTGRSDPRNVYIATVCYVEQVSPSACPCNQSRTNSMRSAARKTYRSPVGYRQIPAVPNCPP